jgi:protein involved in polysaccharide export with SLBB domain
LLNLHWPVYAIIKEADVKFVSIATLLFLAVAIGPAEGQTQQQSPQPNDPTSPLNQQTVAPTQQSTQANPSPYSSVQAPQGYSALPDNSQLTVQPATSMSGSQLLGAPSIATPPPPVSIQFPPAIVQANDGATAPIFGGDMFTGAFAGSTVGTRADYLVQPGDIIELKTYGSLSLDIPARVNADGNIFVPILGPVRVGGVQQSNLNRTLQAQLSKIYTNIQVATDIVQPGAIGVYVTGNVSRPGRYLGLPNDSVLYYLDKAGGIDGRRGSFRNVIIRHRNGTVESVDLYRFRIAGELRQTKFADGDSIVVAPRGPLVVVSGLVRNPFAFELPSAVAPNQPPANEMRSNGGADIVEYAIPDRTATSVSIHSFRDGNPVAAYTDIASFRNSVLGDGDHVEFRSDTVANSVTVAIQAQLGGPSVYVVRKGTTLREVLALVQIDGSNVDPFSVHILRKSVAEQQKKALDESLLELQKHAYSATSMTQEGATIQASQGALIDKFVQAARQVQPEGQVAIYRDGVFQNVRLEEGDQIVIPEKSDVVLVTGEVLAPGAAAARSNATVRDYIDDAGGFTTEADTDHFVLRSRNGASRVVRGSDAPKPGDEILVVPEVNDQDFQLAKDISSLIFQTALTAATVLRL